MTGDQIRAEARANFGEPTAVSLADATVNSYINTALRELYNLLPLAELEVLAVDTTVALSAGKGKLPVKHDHLLAVSVAGVGAQVVPLDVISTIDRSAFFETFVPVAASDGENLWVRPTSHANCIVTEILPPADITDFTLAVILPKWHAVLVLFTTAFAYAQEEDKGQAQHYRNEALALINRTFTAPEQEVVA